MPPHVPWSDQIFTREVRIIIMLYLGHLCLLVLLHLILVGHSSLDQNYKPCRNLCATSKPIESPWPHPHIHLCGLQTHLIARLTSIASTQLAFHVFYHTSSIPPLFTINHGSQLVSHSSPKPYPSFDSQIQHPLASIEDRASRASCFSTFPFVVYCP